MRSIFLEKPDPLELRLRNSSLPGQIRVWMPVVLACLVIAAESTDTFSAAHTGGWLRTLLEHIFGPMRDDTAGAINHYLRKTGHFCGYGTVCLTFLRAWLLTFGTVTDLGRRAWRSRSVLAAVISTTLVASMDEWHQSFIPSRTGTVQDVALDTTGAAVSCALVWLFFWRRQRRGRTLR